MTRAVIDTTVLTDILLNSGDASDEAKNALSQFDHTLLPVYAIKEFKAGPLSNFAWMHNKLVTLDSYEKSLFALQRMSLTPKRYTTATALQGLQNAAKSIGHQTTSDLQSKYGADATLDKILCDEFRLSIRYAIVNAWKKRRKITTDVIQTLTCYREVPPTEKRGLLDLKPTGCTGESGCSMASTMKSKPDELKAMRNAIVQSDKTENKRRAKVLRQLYRKPKSSISNKDCRYLGDAVFVFLAQPEDVILTTNINDHVLLADAVSKRALSPHQLNTKKK